jgi:CubicO group peptidase (beta-lactamase class C family)
MIARRSRAGWVVVTLLLIASGASAQTPKVEGFKPEGIEKLDRRLARAVEGKEIAGAVALLVRDDKVGYSRAVGLRDREANAPMTTDAIFRIASMSKPITSVAAMILVEEGKLALDDPVAKYIPEFGDMTLLDGPRAGRAMTVRHLLTHTSGLTYRFFGGPLSERYAKDGISDGLTQTEGTIADFARKIAGEPLMFTPGTSWNYSLSTDVLGRVIEVASGKPLDEFFRERIFTPLKMKDTAFFLPPEKAGRLAVLYQAGPEHTLNRAPEEPIHSGTLVYSANYHYKGPRTYFSGGAGLATTTGDYTRFLRMLLNGGELEGVRVLKAETVKAMTTNQITEFPLTLGSIHGDRFGYGFGVVTPAGKDKTPMSVGSYGWAGFFHTIFWVDPEKKLVGLLMTQVNPASTTIQRDFIKAAYEALED